MADATLEDKRRYANELIAYHSPISARLTRERTSYHSQLIPVTAYILVACAEAFYRYPAMMRRIAEALDPAEIGRHGHRPGSNVNSVYLWSIANFWLTGRKIVTSFDPSADDVDAAYTVLSFWERAARAFRHDDGTRQADDADGVVRPYAPGLITALVDATSPVEPDEVSRVRTFNATLVNYLFLLYFDTRVGAGDTGPYQLDDGRTVIVRDFYRMGQSDFWWSDVASDVPYHSLTATLVLDGVKVRITDFGTCITEPESYLDRLVAFGLHTTAPDGTLRPVALDEIDAMVGAVRAAQARLFRNIAAMSRDEMVRCGAYVYFTFLKPFAEVAGVADELDWQVPAALPPPVYEFLASVDGADVDVAGDDREYYAPLA